MDALYIDVFQSAEESETDSHWVPLESLLALFTVRFCKGSSVNVFAVKKERSETLPSYPVSVKDLSFVEAGDVPVLARSCQLPAIVLSNEKTCVAGLCSVLRQIVKKTSRQSLNGSAKLLGFRNNCLMACAETSTWTKFCEIDIIDTVKSLTTDFRAPRKVDVRDEYELPVDVVRFEKHLGQPLRIHNIRKRESDYIKKRSEGKEDGVDSTPKENCKSVAHVGNKLIVGQGSSLEHSYAEGPEMTLADIILFPCFYLIFNILENITLTDTLPLTLKWFRRMTNTTAVTETISLVGSFNVRVPSAKKINIPIVPSQSLYKRDPRRYKPQNRIFTKQDDIDVALEGADGLLEMLVWDAKPFGSEVNFDWSAVPFEAHPLGGDLPVSRLERKCQQLDNLAKAALKLARPGDTIVDFCSGGGHLGIILAHFLPRCRIILLENKEESLGRAKVRVEKLKLSNVVFFQCNLDYFCGTFDIGVSLHACGVATDLVIQSCIDQKASFVCCPCCYGFVQNNHIVSYPRSTTFQKSAVTPKYYIVIGHSADQTHDAANAKTEQGKSCMNLVDTDRCLYAQENGYVVHISKLLPESCTPKNNLLVGYLNSDKNFVFDTLTESMSRL